jgi:hypothetical protein
MRLTSERHSHRDKYVEFFCSMTQRVKLIAWLGGMAAATAWTISNFQRKRQDAAILHASRQRPYALQDEAEAAIAKTVCSNASPLSIATAEAYMRRAIAAADADHERVTLEPSHAKLYWLPN